MATKYEFFNGGNLVAGDSGSVFDPVLCEIAYSWFSPPGGVIYDPFAGGSVRGVVAARLGREYHGVELRKEQVEANREQWDRIGSPEVVTRDPMKTEVHDGVTVVRHDAHVGGTKQAVFERLIAPGGAWSAHAELVYATPAYGFAQVGLAAACKAHGKKATIFVADRKKLHPTTLLAEHLGANVVRVKPGYLSNVQKKARDYCEKTGAEYLPFGGDVKEVHETIRDIALELQIEAPKEVWTVAGSGTLTRGLQLAWPEAEFHAVQIGKDPELGRAKLHKSSLEFEQESNEPPPFDSNLNYDAKAWSFIQEHAKKGALFWNVGGRPNIRPEATEFPSPTWIHGDSTKVEVPKKPDSDMVIGCPPYADLEVYSDDPADLSNMPYEDFLAGYRKAISIAVSRLKPDRFAVWVIGEIRDKKGNYRDFVGDTVQAFRDAGAEYYNEAILVTPAGTLPLRTGRQFAAGRKLGKTHQNVLVFVKGDGKKAAQACGDVVVHVPDVDEADETE